jgi:LemA protein
LNGKVALVGVVLILLVLGASTVVTYNSLVGSRVEVDEALANIHTEIQRRADLIPRVVNATNMYVNYEQKLYTDIAAARSAWAQALGGNVQDQAAASQQLSDVSTRLLAVLIVENYPDLKANQVVLTLIDELEGTENRIAVARTRYNEAVSSYNKGVLGFPGNIFAGVFGFTTRPFFSTTQTGDLTPP